MLVVILMLVSSAFIRGQVVTVMTFNIRYDDKKGEPDSWGNRKGEVLKLIDSRSPHIFGVQEALENQLQDIDAYFTDHAHIGADRNNDGSGEYSAIFFDTTKFFLKKQSTFWLHPQNKPEKAWDAAFPRIVTYGIFEKKGSGDSFLLFNTHFDHVGKVARKASVDLILDSIRLINTEGHPVILMGDFNMVRTDLPMLKLANLMTDAARENLADTIGTFNGFRHDIRPHRVIDYILYRGDIAPLSAEIVSDQSGGRFPSDHLPVVATFQLDHFNRAIGPAKRNLNEGWAFDKSPHERKDENIADLRRFDEPIEITLPHTWNAADVMDETPGYAREKHKYARMLDLDTEGNGTRYHLYFEGANQVLDLWVNDRYVGRHVGGYTSFSFDVTPYLLEEGPQVIVLTVDNTHHPDIIPLEADFNFYGGIYRDVWLIKTSETHFDRSVGSSSGVYYTTEVTGGAATIHVRYEIDHKGTKEETVTIEQLFIDPRQKEVRRESRVVVIEPGLNIHEIEGLEISDPVRWQPGNPKLYRAITRLYDSKGEKIDEVKQQIGLRTISFTKEDGFVINGKRMKLIGTNRHQDHGGIGNALSNEQHIDDMLHLKALGINFLRISHYPQDPVVLAMCNQLGFVATEEIPFVNEATVSEAFRKNTINMLREMIRRDYNHPAIFAWISSNELTLRLNSMFRNKPENEKRAYTGFLQQLLDDIHEEMKVLDPDRYSMIVHCCGKERNKALGLHNADLIGYNKYFGWYEGTFDGIDPFVRQMDTLEPDKPFVLSEFGAGADPRIHTLSPRRFDFSIEYQTEYHKAHLRSILDSDLFPAVNVWNYADFMAEHRRDAVPHVNNKGIVDLYRNPKDAFYYYQAVLADEPYVIIPSRMWTRRAGIASLEKVSSQPISVFSNLESAELWQNGTSLGCRAIEDFEATWDVPFTDGQNELVAKPCGENQGPADTLQIDFELWPGDFSNGMPDTLRINIGSHCFFIDGSALWVPDQPYQSGTYGHVDGKAYLRDGKELVGTARDITGTEKDPVYQTALYDLSTYRIDVPNGRYKVIFHLANVFENESRLVPGLEDGDAATVQSNQILLNGIPVGEVYAGVGHLNTVKQYHAYQLERILRVQNNAQLNISFTDTGFNYLNGLEIIRL